MRSGPLGGSPSEPGEYEELGPGGLVPFGEYDGVAVDSGEFTDLIAGNLRMIECRIARSSIERAELPRSSFVDCIVEDTRLVAATVARSQWRDSAVRRSLLAGLDLSGSTLRRVTIADSKLDTVNLRAANLRDVVFRSCVIGELDLGEATLTRCAFQDCQLIGLDLTKTKLTAVDLRTSRLDLRRGYLSLAGAIIDLGQLLELAPSIAAQLGIDVRAEG